MYNNILFICTGNYYRSRYAEMYFNDLALKMRINWKAVSRGIAAYQANNVGPISMHTLERLKLRGISIGEQIRFPLQLEEKDLLEADLIIALNRREHQPMMEGRFAAWADRIKYWDIPDLNITDSENALSGIERNIYTLMEEVRSSR